jgi:hypothetical protein
MQIYKLLHALSVGLNSGEFRVNKHLIYVFAKLAILNCITTSSHPRFLE